MTHITDDMVQAAVMAYVRSGKQDADMMRAMRAALEAADNAAWRPIEEASCSPNNVLLWDVPAVRPTETIDRKGFVRIDRFVSGLGFGCASVGSEVRRHATHFRPLPKGPTT